MVELGLQVRAADYQSTYFSSLILRLETQYAAPNLSLLLSRVPSIFRLPDHPAS